MNISSDLKNYILSEFLEDKDALSWMMSNKIIYNYIDKYKLKNYYSYKVITKSKCMIQKLKNLSQYSRNPKLYQTLTHLKFGDKFNQKINEFPETLIHLEFGYNFNQIIEKFPKKLEYLAFGNGFNQKIKDLPESLLVLQFGIDFNQKIENLPTSITSLSFKGLFNQKIENFPQNLRFLYFGSLYSQKLENLPDSLKRLTLSENYPYLDDFKNSKFILFLK